MANDVLKPSVPLQAISGSKKRSPILEYTLPVDARCVDFTDDGLVVGHSQGVLFLARQDNGDQQPIFASIYQHYGLAVDSVKSSGPYLAATHPDYSISFQIRAPGREQAPWRFEGSHSHDSFVNAVDISTDGVLASTGDDRQVIVHDSDQNTQIYPLSQRGLDIKFRVNQQSDQLVVLEAGNKIRILDWNKGLWLVTIFGGMPDPIREIGVLNSSILTVGAGWWRSYRLETLAGGCGYTQPDNQGQLLGSAVLKHGNGSNNEKEMSAVSSDGRFVANVNTTAIDIHDIVSSGGRGIEVSYKFSGAITASAVRNGGIVAIVSGKTLTLVGPHLWGDRE